MLHLSFDCLFASTENWVLGKNFFSILFSFHFLAFAGTKQRDRPWPIHCTRVDNFFFLCFDCVLSVVDICYVFLYLSKAWISGTVMAVRPRLVWNRGFCNQGCSVFLCLLQALCENKAWDQRWERERWEVRNNFFLKKKNILLQWLFKGRQPLSKLCILDNWNISCWTWILAQIS